MKRIFIFSIWVAIFFFPGPVVASTASSVVETQVEGENVQVQQVVETTVNGQTVIKESSQPGRLEVKMEKTGENEPTVTFSQTSGNLTPTLAPRLPQLEPLFSLTGQIRDFVRKLLDNLLTSWFK